MNTVSNEVLANTEIEITSIVRRFVNNIEEATAAQISKEIIALIDWNDPYLMHKGLSWMVKNYLIRKSLIQSIRIAQSLSVLWQAAYQGGAIQGSITTNVAGKQTKISHWKFINGKWFAFGASGQIMTG